MDGFPRIRVSPFFAPYLLLAAGPALAQYGAFHTAEPPLANTATDSEIQQASAQVPVNVPQAQMPSAVPSVSVDVVAPSRVAFNEPLSYRLLVRNVSNYPASDVWVIHPLNGAKIDKADPPVTKTTDKAEWNIGSLKPGESREIKLTVTPKADATAFDAIALVRFEHGRKAAIKITRPEISLKVNVAKSIQQGDATPVEVIVQNAGPMEVKDIRVSLALPDGITLQADPRSPSENKGLPTWTVARLGPNEHKNFDFRVVGAKPGPVSIQAIAVPGNAPRVEASTEVAVQPPRLELIATGPSQRPAGQTVTYRAAVKNAGTFLMTNVTVTDLLPPGCEYVTATDGGRQFDKQVQWILPLLNPGETRVVEVTVRNSGVGSVTHQFDAIYGKVTQTSRVATSLDTTALIRVDFRGSPQTVDFNGTVQYVFTVDNSGAAAATGVRAVVSLPDVLSVTATNPTVESRDSTRVVFNAITIQPGGRQVYTVTARPMRATSGATITAEVTCNELEAGAIRRTETTAIIGSR